MAEASGLWVTIKARTSNFQKGVKNARKSLGNFKRSIPGVNMLLNKFTIAIGAAAAALGTTVWVKNTLAAVDATAKFADRIGMTVEGLQTLQHAATLTGVGVSSLQMGLQRMTRRVAEAAQGTGEAKAALKELRLSARELSQMRPEDMFRKIAGAMSRIPAQGDRVRLAMKLFDSEGVALVNTLNMGEAGLDALNERLAKTGLLFSRVDAARIEEANDAIANLKLTVQAVANLSVSILAPAITKVTESLRGWVEGKGNIRERLFDMFEKIGGWIGDFIDAVRKAMIAIQTGIGGALSAIGMIPGVDASVGKQGEMMIIASEKARQNFKSARDAILETLNAMKTTTTERTLSQLGISRVSDDLFTRTTTSGRMGVRMTEVMRYEEMRNAVREGFRTGRQDDPQLQQIAEILRAINREIKAPAFAR